MMQHMLMFPTSLALIAIRPTFSQIDRNQRPNNQLKDADRIAMTQVDLYVSIDIACNDYV